MLRSDKSRRPPLCPADGGLGKTETKRATPLGAVILTVLALLTAIGRAIPVGAKAGQAVAGQPAIPEPGFAPGWAKAGVLRTFTGQDLFNQIDGGAELFLEFGFSKMRLQAYTRDKSELTLNAYEMESAASALGIYLMKMGKETPFPEVAARNSSEEAQLTVFKGRYFVQIDNLGDEPAAKADAVAMANSFLNGITGEPVVSPLAELPVEDRVPASERLIRGPYGLQPYFTFGEGDILSMGGKVFGALAEYRAAGGVSFTRLIVPYPSPDAAAAALAHLKANLDRYIKVSADRADGFDFADFQDKKGAVALTGSTLDLRFKIAD
jgi:hypothetical protein